MKTFASEYNEQNSFFTTSNEKDDEELNSSHLKSTIESCEEIFSDNICRTVTVIDVNQALKTLKIRRKRTISTDSDTSTMLPEQKTQSTIECNCCRLLRSDKSSRLSLPLARRGRPHLSSRSRRLLCNNCLKIKHKQQNDILQKLDQHQHYHDETTSPNIFDTMIDLDKTSEQEHKRQMIIQDIPHEIEFSLINENEKNHLNNTEYQSAEMLVWKINTSENQNQTNTIDVSYDTGTLTENERKNLLIEAVQKLQIVLNNRSTSTTTIPASDLDKIEFTYQALQTTVNILSSSLNYL